MVKVQGVRLDNRHHMTIETRSEVTLRFLQDRSMGESCDEWLLIYQFNNSQFNMSVEGGSAVSCRNQKRKGYQQTPSGSNPGRLHVVFSRRIIFILLMLKMLKSHFCDAARVHMAQHSGTVHCLESAVV